MWSKTKKTTVLNDWFEEMTTKADRTMKMCNKVAMRNRYKQQHQLVLNGQEREETWNYIIEDARKPMTWTNKKKEIISMAQLVTTRLISHDYDYGNTHDYD